MSDKASTRINQVTQGMEHVRAAKPTQSESCEQRSENSEISSPERSNHQERSDKASTKTDQVAQDKEHIRAGRPAQDMNCGQRSDLREIPNPEKSNPREVAESATIRVNQEVPVESIESAETKQDAGLAPEEDEDDAADGITTDLRKPTDENPDSKGSEEISMNKDGEKHDIPWVPDDEIYEEICINKSKLESHKGHTWDVKAEDGEEANGDSSNTVTQAANKNDCTKFDIKHVSRFRIVPVISMKSDLRIGAELISNEDTNEKDNRHEFEAEDGEKVDGGDSNTVTQATKESDCTNFDVEHDSRL